MKAIHFGFLIWYPGHEGSILGLESYFYTSMCQRCEFMGLSHIRQKVAWIKTVCFAVRWKGFKGFWGFNEGSCPLDHTPNWMAGIRSQIWFLKSGSQPDSYNDVDVWLQSSEKQRESSQFRLVGEIWIWTELGRKNRASFGWMEKGGLGWETTKTQMYEEYVHLRGTVNSLYFSECSFNGVF